MRGRVILDIPAFTLPSGAHAVVTGPSGCGKTTLLSLVAGLLPLSSGRVAVDGEDLGAIASRGARAIDLFRARRIGLVPQQPMLFGMLDALDNVLAARYFAGEAPDRDGARALLAQLGLAGLERRRPRELSRGQQQRVALARSLVNAPRLILADEPTANLDDTLADQVLDLLVERAGALGATLLIATHDARVRARFDGQLVLPPAAAAAPAPIPRAGAR
jgi:putative ABC transport system ATP-binding protein